MGETPKPQQTKTIRVGNLARVEGEGALYVRVKGSQVEEVRLNIFEPPRFFEAFLRGRSFAEVPDITARICGICPVAYQMSSCQALEAALGVQVEGPLKALRRLLYCGEWIESHALHIYFLHLPDFLGYPDAVRLAQDQPERIQQALALKKTGNELMALLGGREIHPINVKVGGFYRVPRKAELLDLRDKLERAREIALQTVHFVGGLDFPDFAPDYTFVSLRQEGEYPILGGRLVSSRGLDIAVAEFEQHFREEHVPHSNALHATLEGRPYLVGPLARYNLNFDQLPTAVQAAAREAGLGPVCRNPFQSIVVRAVETLYACEEALRLIAEYEEPDAPSLAITPRAGEGAGCSEAPRGILYHRYRIDEQGLITEARIVPPTSQNQKMIEEDLRQFVAANLELPKPELTLRCEQTIRNYDPCISCATHFLRLEIEQAP
ncbi:Ni/Fe hydrogenase subunit alpha [Meiothermus hypogaeus]|uniref:Ni/Fe hydrogenase subunit alpha n=2 Tax=Meiothermus hypogaeus TaxID=884155 RepID=A0A511R0F2_9DEIN|nr:Ni/Fe hydrogenase subunit alpha [Meiothermus hypogaeus]RIH77569.1 NAD-reducing hydrogenase HoxS subunit beta [Meiothermus hypogaeus]GEM83093.1 Ni/Fe hydrogenase subunit alpha [Meiothermus hypogaeus NBRC 106114]